MNNRKRVTLTFEIDDHDGYNDEAFMRRDFLQELSCCVNNPYADTFVMKVEGADVPHEMSAVEFLRALPRMYNLFPLMCVEYERWLDLEEIEKAVAVVERFAKEHPEERSEE